MLTDRYDPLKEEMFQVCDPEGNVDRSVEPKLPDRALKKIYFLMLLARRADDKSLKLQRQGRMGTFAPSYGHEACQVGSAFPLKPQDRVFPYFRDLGVYLTLGYPLKNHFLYWMGSEKGIDIPPTMHLFPPAIPVASQIPHSVGAALAASIRNEALAVISYFGDGATSEGDFHEALNFSGVFRAPNVFLCVNNQYAISLPRKRQTASPTLAQKALAYGFKGLLVDGNDVLAVYAAAKEALDRARRGGGPTLIEACTYRLSDHTTSDDAARYRRPEEVEKWKVKDPLKRFRIYLNNKNLWDEAAEAEAVKKADELIQQAVEAAETAGPPSVEELFAHTYSVLPPDLRMQMEETRRRRQEKKP